MGDRRGVKGVMDLGGGAKAVKEIGGGAQTVGKSSVKCLGKTCLLKKEEI